MSKDKKEVSKEIIEKAGGVANLRRLEIPTDDLGQTTIEIIACVPSRQVMGQYLKFNNVNPAKAQEILVKNCILTDLETVMADDALFMTAVSQLAELIPVREGRIKKY